MKMKKFLNKSEDITKEVLEGLVMSNCDLLELKEGNIVVSKALSSANRVTVVTIGGAGHEPALSGFVGDGMLDISIVGDVFAAPGPDRIIEAIKIADKGKGVLLVVLNHAGDMLAGNMVMKKVAELGLNVKKLVTQEDVSNAPRENSDDRRGLVGCVPTYKIAASAAKAGKSLDEVYEIASRFANNMATLAVACRTATHPQSGAEFSDLGDNDMEVGMGQHGEGGGGRMPMKTADKTAKLMLEALIKDIGIKSGDKIMLIINGTGATTLMEMLIVYRACVKMLETKNIKIVANMVGEILTVQEQAGFQMFLAKMDDELLSLWNEPCNTPYYKKIK